jgi:hypothetical protein
MRSSGNGGSAFSGGCKTAVRMFSRPPAVSMRSSGGGAIGGASGGSEAAARNAACRPTFAALGLQRRHQQLRQ